MASRYITDRPLSPQELDQEARDISFNPSVPIKYYGRTITTIYQEALTYYNEGNIGKAYMLFLRYSDLFLKHLQTHPQIKTPEGKALAKQSRGQVRKVIDYLEQLKPQVQAQYDEYIAAQTSRGSSQRNDRVLSWRQTRLDPREHSSFAVGQALREVQRRDAARRATRQAGVTDEQEQQRRVAGIWDDWDSGDAWTASAQRQRERENQTSDEDETRRQMEAARRQLDAADPTRFEREAATEPRPLSVSYNYPSFQKSRPVRVSPPATAQPQHQQPAPSHSTLPPRPPKDPFSGRVVNRKNSFDALIPVRPQKVPIPETAEPATTDDYPPAYHNALTDAWDSPPSLPPKVPEILKSSSARDEVQLEEASRQAVFSAGATLESGEELRSLFIPPGLRRIFLKIAQPNTSRNLEFCGLLCGILHKNALFITMLLIPDQTATSDTCETTDEDKIWQYCTDNDLMIFGWIHTHPTQTCFMSSRDLHTHASYQVQLPESIAIVCAPSQDPDYGIFRLTDPPGKAHVISCNKPGIFHPHDIDDLYTTAVAPSGHVVEIPQQFPLAVHDMRAKRA